MASFDYFDMFTPSSKTEKAHEIWDERVKTQEGQLECLNTARQDVTQVENPSKAKKDKELACIYIYDRMKPQIVSQFKKMFLNNATDHTSDNSRVFDNGTLEEFANTAYLFISGNSLQSRRKEDERVTPYARVDKEVAEGSDEKDWLVTFQFGLMNCLQTVGRRIISDENAVNRGETSYDAFGGGEDESNLDNADVVADENTPTQDETFEQISVNEFLAMLEKDYPELYQMYQILSEHSSWTWRDIEMEFGINRTAQNRRKAELKELTSKYFTL